MELNTGQQGCLSFIDRGRALDALPPRLCKHWLGSGLADIQTKKGGLISANIDVTCT